MSNLRRELDDTREELRCEKELVEEHSHTISERDARIGELLLLESSILSRIFQSGFLIINT